MVFKFGEVASLDGVPAEFRFAYTTQPNSEGNFVVQEGAKAFVEAYSGQATALEAERGKVRALSNENAQRRTALKPWEDLIAKLGITVPEGEEPTVAVENHISGLTDKVKGGESFKANLEKIRTESEKRIAELTRTHTVELGAMSSTLEQYLVDREALAALAAAKAKGGGKVLLPVVKNALKVVKDENGHYVVRAIGSDGQVRYNSAAQPMTVAEVVAETKANPEYAFTFESEAGSGIGTRPGTGSVPAARTTPPNEQNPTQKISAGLDALTKR